MRFSVSERTRVDTAGGHVFGVGTGFVSAAIIGLPNDQLPSGSDLSQMDLRASALWDLDSPTPSSERFVAMDLVLEVGDYALLFGATLPCANGAGGMPRGSDNGTEDIGEPDYLVFNDLPNGGFWRSNSNQRRRFVVRGVSVPEPTSATILIGLAAVVALRRRR